MLNHHRTCNAGLSWNAAASRRGAPPLVELFPIG
jgi:hypothetical protein